jgi:hypothetical protein
VHGRLQTGSVNHYTPPAHPKPPTTTTATTISLMTDLLASAPPDANVPQRLNAYWSAGIPLPAAAAAAGAAGAGAAGAGAVGVGGSIVGS